ncbi:hypothetical protein Salat_2800100 [Sesamum alatum]|uniref:Uncharacterized protein n=1 Tax=Sesamum alatum TaxID=300844 RepID=A0AAE1XL50_9LAMI|nr:hypothetical protein Salat_2800100 [Sesamum alatum]
MEKEERRRKNNSSRTDRMALITGRIQTLDPEPITKCSSFTGPRQDRFHPRNTPAPHRNLWQQMTKSCGDYVADTVMRHVNHHDVAKGYDSESRASNLLKFEPKEVATLTPDNVNLHEKLFSFDLAILVVLSHANLPRDGVKPKSLIAYRPIFVVLLTDMFILAAKLAPFAQTRKDDKEPQVEENGGGENWGGAVQLLELGVVLHQTVRALFIDFSFYLVIVVCGLSLI